MPLHLTHSYFKHSGMSHINSLHTLNTQVTESLMTLSVGGRPTESGTSKQSHCACERCQDKKNSLTYAVSLQGFSWIKSLSTEISLLETKWLSQGSTKQDTSQKVQTATSAQWMHNTLRMVVMLESFSVHPVNLTYTSYKNTKTFTFIFWLMHLIV